jgi:predicted  nucleic acid-binding Zn-ribbon protein
MSDTVHIVKCNVLNAVQSQEIITLKDRIIQLEEELMDAKNKYAALVADVVLYEDRAERIKRLDETLEAVTDKIDNAWGIYMKFKEAKP